MLIDSLVQLTGEDPAQFSTTEDKWIALSVDLTIFIAIPFYLLFLLALPFLFLWWKKKRFSFRNILISLVVSAILFGFGLFSLVAAFYTLQSLAFLELYGI